MEYYNGKLCVTYDDLAGIATMNAIQCIVKKDASIQARKACRSNPALFDLDRLPLKFQLEVYRRRPDLKAQAESKPFVESVEPDGAALDFYQRHQFGDGKYLSTDKQTEYANNAAVLNAFRLVLERSDSQHRKQSKRCISKAEFWRKAAQALPRIADTFPHTLPENPRRLQEKFNQYVREGYGALITGKYGTRNAAKIDDDTKESLLIRLISDARNLDNAQIARIYNVVAETQGWKTITGAAVGVWREKHDLVTAGGRLGETRFRNQRSMQVKRSRPTAPLLYWTMDGWVSELLYQRQRKRTGVLPPPTRIASRLLLSSTLVSIIRSAMRSANGRPPNLSKQPSGMLRTTPPSFSDAVTTRIKYRVTTTDEGTSNRFIRSWETYTLQPVRTTPNRK